MSEEVNFNRGLATRLRVEAIRIGRGIPSDESGFHKDLWSAACIIDRVADELDFNAHAENVFSTQQEQPK